jgi:dTDP-4-dehydrorhamnose reductase
VILVFGGNGQLGRELAREAVARGVALVSLVRSQADITDYSAILDALKRYEPAIVINAAAYAKVDLAETEIEKAHSGNAIGPANLARACAEAQLSLVHISTDYVFNGAKRGAYSEGDPVCPISSYGRSKAAGEACVRRALSRHIILRTSWVYSEFGQNFLKTIVYLASTKDELHVVADQRGSPTSASDLASAILRIVPRLLSREDSWGTYHFAGAGATTWFGFAKRIVAAQAPLTGRTPRVTAISTADYPTAAPRPANSELDCSLFVKVFGFGAQPWTEVTDAVTRAVVANSERTHVA